ncbi:MAG: hypothetical protein H7227_03150 [Actinobacteria bacterium]|nr:hypothetical protein [Actinomycetota bacterium]
MISIHGPAVSKVDRLDPRYINLLSANRRLAKKDATLWGAAAAKEAENRLNWIDLASTSRDLLPELDSLHARFRDFTRVVLCGMGGSSLAPEVIASTFGKELFVLDSTDPDYVGRSFAGDLASTVVVVSSKSGSTIETSSQLALFEDQFTKANLMPKNHIVIVTDPGSPLDAASRAKGYTVVNADPQVGGRFSALTAFGLVPSALLGIDISVLLDSAADAREILENENSLAVDLAYLISFCAGQYCAFTDAESGMIGLADWIEQLIAESTGKDGAGRLPVVTESTTAPVAGDALNISFSGKGELVVQGELGEHFLLWEWITALVGYALQIDPFNQPNVTEAKLKTAALLANWVSNPPVPVPNFVEGSVQIFAAAASVQAALLTVIDHVPDDGYISIMAYLDRKDDEELAQLRSILATKSGRPVTFGWGPRFLHSTGQFHKGGQQNGVFLQITGANRNDIDIPGKSFSFGTLIQAQALGDGQTLTERNRLVVRLHLTNRENGISEILSAAREII